MRIDTSSSVIMIFRLLNYFPCCTSAPHCTRLRLPVVQVEGESDESEEESDYQPSDLSDDEEDSSEDSEESNWSAEEEDDGTYHAHAQTTKFRGCATFK